MGGGGRSKNGGGGPLPLVDFLGAGVLAFAPCCFFGGGALGAAIRCGELDLAAACLAASIVAAALAWAVCLANASAANARALFLLGGIFLTGVKLNL